MGFIKHDAIVVTSGDLDELRIAKRKARRLGLETTNIVSSRVNQYHSFLITPDGSKENNSTSVACDSRRKEWRLWVDNQGFISIQYVHVAYSSDDRPFARIESISHSLTELE